MTKNSVAIHFNFFGYSLLSTTKKEWDVYSESSQLWKLEYYFLIRLIYEMRETTAKTTEFPLAICLFFI